MAFVLHVLLPMCTHWKALRFLSSALHEVMDTWVAHMLEIPEGLILVFIPVQTDWLVLILALWLLMIGSIRGGACRCTTLNSLF